MTAREHRVALENNPTGSRPWMNRAACKDMDTNIWYPERGASLKTPISICRECPVREQCLNYALEHGEKSGVWGGISERGRRAMRRNRRQEAA